MLVWMFEYKHVFMRRERREFCMSACMYLSEYVCTAIWPNRHANTAKISEEGSVFRVKVLNTAYQAISLSSCHSSDVRKQTSLYPEHIRANSARSSLCQVETNGMMREIMAKPALKKEMLTESLWCLKVRMHHRKRLHAPLPTV